MATVPSDGIGIFKARLTGIRRSALVVSRFRLSSVI